MAQKATVYDTFARFYDKMHHGEFSKWRYDAVCEHLTGRDFSSLRLLDMACGTGTFCELMAAKCVAVVGFDLSPKMVDIAKRRNIPNAEFFVADMSGFETDGTFDVITCHYDSLNHLLSADRLQKTFVTVLRHLKPSGMFLFDMNTIAGLRLWHDTTFRHDDTSVTVFEGAFDEQANTATVTIDACVQRGDGLYERFQLTVTEAAFPFAEIDAMLRSAGFADVTPIERSAGKTLDELEADPRVFICAKL